MNDHVKQSCDSDTALQKRFSADGAGTDHIRQTRDLLEQHPHFRGHADEIQIEIQDGTIILSGKLPSFYLKQQLQEVVRCVAGTRRIDNRVAVVAADGLSSMPDRT